MKCYNTFVIKKRSFVLRYLRTIYLDYACGWQSNVIDFDTILNALPCHCATHKTKHVAKCRLALLSPSRSCVKDTDLVGGYVSAGHAGDEQDVSAVLKHEYCPFPQWFFNILFFELFNYI